MTSMRPHHLYQDGAASAEDRTADLLGRMTTAEKAAQLVGAFPFAVLGPTGVDHERVVQLCAEGIGHFSTVVSLAPDEVAPMVGVLNEVQRYLVEETRLGIPAMLHVEALSGINQARAVNFPTAIALAASWSPELVEDMASFISTEMSALGIRQALSPVLDVARDARWGRIHETYGEDPYLCSAMGVAFVRGLQGAGLDHGVAATAKHFLAYGLSEGGRNIAPAAVSERELYEVFARPFEAAIRQAGLASAMNSYSELNGEVPTGSAALLNGLLRDRLGFEGVVVADYGSVAMLHDRHGLAESPTDAGVMAINAGLDIELPARDCFAGLERAVEVGLVDIATVDEAVRRALLVKFRVGLFDNPYGDAAAFATIDRNAAEALAGALARRSAVLLKNEANLLPLGSDVSTIAVIGPNADSVRNLFSGYTAASMVEITRAIATASGDAPDLTGGRLIMETVGEEPVLGMEEAVRAMYPKTRTLLEAIRAVASPQTRVDYEQGCTINGSDRAGLAAAIDLARRADVVVLALGDKTGWVADATSGEGRDRSTLDLPGLQEELIRDVIATGSPTVVVLVNGRPAPVGIGDGEPRAVIEAWQPGAAGMDHVAEILFGMANPCGKLPITVPRTAGQCPIYHYQHRAGSYAGTGVRRYTDGPASPAYPFGHGLSYTTFTYRDLILERDSVATDSTATISVRVANSGDLFGEEVVQLYAQIPVRGVARPVHELIGFGRVALEPGQEATVRFDVDAAQLACLGPDLELAVHPGIVTVSAGGSSADLPLSASFTITGDRRPLDHRTAFTSRATVTYGAGLPA